MNKEKLEKEFEKFLNPRLLRNNLIRGSLFLTAFELLKYSVENKIKSFLCVGGKMDENYEYKNCKEYRDAIINRKIPELNNIKNTYYSSCLWLKEHGAISEKEVEELQLIRLHRNKIGHELPKLILDNDHEINLELFKSIRKLLTKIDQWWIVEIEMPTSPEYDGLAYEKLNMDEVKSGTMTMLDYLVGVLEEEMK